MEGAGVRLTTGAIDDINNGRAAKSNPVVQVIDLKLVQTAKRSAEIYRMLLSDGVRAAQAMLATDMNGLVESRTLRTGSIVLLIDFEPTIIQNRRIIVVYELDVIVETFKTIGEPRVHNDNLTAAFSPVPSEPPPLHPSQASDLSPQSGTVPVTAGSVADVCAQMHISTKTELATRCSFSPHSGTFSSHMANQECKNHVSAHNSGLKAILNPQTSTCDRPCDEQAQASPSYHSRGSLSPTESTIQIIAIAELNPHMGRWAIKGRITIKGDLRPYSSSKGDGKIFSFVVLDGEGGEIRITSFNNVADQFYSKICIGEVYLISRGSVKLANKKFNSLNCNYEIILDSTSIVQHCTEDDSIPRQQFNFNPIAEIEGFDDNMLVDVIGFVLSITPSVTIMRKNGQVTLKRTLILKDMSGKGIEVALWGDFCSKEGLQLAGMHDSGLFPVLAVKSGRVSDFNEKTINTISTTQLFIDPDFPEALRLKDWRTSVGRSYFSISILSDIPSVGRLENRKTINQIINEHLGRSTKTDFICVKAQISSIKRDNFCYAACPLVVGDRQCNKKVSKNENDTWLCTRCKRSFPECNYRYLLQVQIQDYTGLVWVTAFEDSGEEIMGISAKELYLVKYDDYNHAKFAYIMQNVLYHQYIFRLKVKEEFFSDEQHLKLTIVNAEKVNSSFESRYLIDVIDRLLVEDSATSEFPGVGSLFRISSSGHDDVIRGATVGQIGVSHGKYVADFGMHQSESGWGRYNADQSTGNREMQPGCTPQIMHSGMHMNHTYQSTQSYHHAPGTPYGNCFRCQQPGHWVKDCPKSSNEVSSFRGKIRYE